MLNDLPAATAIGRSMFHLCYLEAKMLLPLESSTCRAEHQQVDRVGVYQQPRVPSVNTGRHLC